MEMSSRENRRRCSSGCVAWHGAGGDGDTMLSPARRLSPSVATFSLSRVAAAAHGEPQTDEVVSGNDKEVEAAMYWWSGRIELQFLVLFFLVFLCSWSEI
ncbi:hypothetical protein DAI22_12g112300 [Oryza sativa Japonica Group]|nr:hypothetical protein DAI22_12g112300 [Oryza sativa Japonica Group]